MKIFIIVLLLIILYNMFSRHTCFLPLCFLNHREGFSSPEAALKARAAAQAANIKIQEANDTRNTPGTPPIVTSVAPSPYASTINTSTIAKNKRIRIIVSNFQKKKANTPPKGFKGCILDGRDITSVIMKNATFKFFITANIKVRAMRRYKELINLKKKFTFQEVLKSIRKRDTIDYNRAISPLKKTKDSILINTTNLSKRACFLKIKKIMDKKIRA